jgi:hypothetical protein
MGIATHEDVYRLFPDIQDHAVVDVMATRPTINELEAAWQMLQENDEGLVAIKQRKGSRLNHLLAILVESQMQVEDDHER